MSFITKIFGTYSEKEVKRVMPIVEKINSLEESISKLSDADLRNKTIEFKERLSNRRNIKWYLTRSFCCS